MNRNIHRLAKVGEKTQDHYWMIDWLVVVSICAKMRFGLDKQTNQFYIESTQKQITKIHFSIIHPGRHVQIKRLVV